MGLSGGGFLQTAKIVPGIGWLPLTREIWALCCTYPLTACEMHPINDGLSMKYVKVAIKPMGHSSFIPDYALIGYPINTRRVIMVHYHGTLSHQPHQVGRELTSDGNGEEAIEEC